MPYPVAVVANEKIGIAGDLGIFHDGLEKVVALHVRLDGLDRVITGQAVGGVRGIDPNVILDLLLDLHDGGRLVEGLGHHQVADGQADDRDEDGKKRR